MNKENKKLLLEAKEELVQKLSIKPHPKFLYRPRLTLGAAVLLKYPEEITQKQLKRLQKLSKKTNDNISLRDVLRTLSIPYEHRFVKNRVVIDYDENKKPVPKVEYGTRVITLN